MKQTVFYIHTGSQSPLVNKLLRCADLANGAIIRDGSGFKLTVSWKKGETVTKARIDRLKPVIKQIFEDMDYVSITVESGV